MIFTAVMLPEARSFFILMGYEPGSMQIQRLNIVAGDTLRTNHQVLLGKLMADTLNKKVGDTIELSGVRFRITGIFESNTSWEEMGGVITLRDSQALMGRARKVSMYYVKIHDSQQAETLVTKINQQFPEVHAALATEFMQQMPDMRSMDAMLGATSLLAILVGGVGVLNTMLMSVFERTREIGVLRALGWRRRSVLGLILREALLLGIIGGVTGIAIAIGLVYLLQFTPLVGEMLVPAWTSSMFLRAISVATLLGALGGIYPALRATRLQPVEALRYE
jgi:putative ABC transport system permease protein